MEFRELENNPEGLNETKTDLRKQYLSAIKRLALEKMKNDLLFEGKLGAVIRNLTALGLNVTRESILKDIEREITKQTYSFVSDESLSQKEGETLDESKAQIASLKENLGAIFEPAPTPVQHEKTIASSLPREPAMQSPRDEIFTSDLSQNNGQQVQPTLVHSEAEIKEQLQQAQEEIKQKLEWAKSQPNEPTVTFTGNLENLSDEVLQKIIEQIESRGDVIISKIDKVYQEGKYIVVDAIDNQGRYAGAEFTLEDFVNLVNQPTIKKETDSLENDRKMPQQITEPSQSPEIIAPTESAEEQLQSPKSMQEQQEEAKDKIISQILNAMNISGELSFGNISMGERMSIIQNIQNKLKAKSLEELQILLATYQEQKVEEETSSRKH